ncbi:MAG: hypothetical protein COY04_00555 [Parcubacteria group bacterium CG_4_10_14_0_2_um_filter_7_35_8]|nr:MAG: hypothetical protein COU70_00630 [Parcubacteria group bacterium CG10_big_fil_rev_8_21_14_0_10_35_15]PIZ77094.1 MAG: hypothetical protein COY04_00555 [Parcubacteria group bacterium CG_4_10_14_0_2_um_filter_7_35_8]
MILKEQQEIIKDIVKEFFNKATIVIEIKEESASSVENEKESFHINIETELPQLLIGENGQTLSEIQHLLRLILRKKIGPDIYFDLDINSYKKKKISYLEELAKTIADEVVLTGQEKELLPMSAQDRRIIHLSLSQRTDVVSESKGQEPNRYVLIKPSELSI